MVTLVIIISLGVKAYSQQDTYIRNSNLFPLKFNPAYTGDQSLNTVMLLTRQQWVGFKGAPKTYLLASHFSLPGYNAALGAEVESSSTGPAKETGLFISYSYKADLSDNSYIVFGLRGGGFSIPDINRRPYCTRNRETIFFRKAKEVKFFQISEQEYTILADSFMLTSRYREY